MRSMERHAADVYRERFGQAPSLVASAPGRINLIGEHTDYNEGFVLPCAIDRRIAVALAPGGGTLYSAEFDETRALDDRKDGSWADYPRGVVWALGETGREVPRWNGAFAGDVPIGSGLSSSAAIEAATALALDTLAALGMSRTELAVACKRAENGYVGVSSGIMDQYASLLCQAGSALLIDCRSLRAEAVPLDLAAAGLVLWVCDTRVERQLGRTAYNDRKAASERAAAAMGLPSLRDADRAHLESLDSELLARARHVVTENERVLQTAEALRRNDFAAVGRLMCESHASLRDDYEVSIEQLDVAVAAAMEGGALGARLTGAGFGGCAIALVPVDRVDGVTALVRRRFAQCGFRDPAFYAFEAAQGAEVVA